MGTSVSTHPQRFHSWNDSAGRDVISKAGDVSATSTFCATKTWHGGGSGRMDLTGSERRVAGWVAGDC